MPRTLAVSFRAISIVLCIAVGMGDVAEVRAQTSSYDFITFAGKYLYPGFRDGVRQDARFGTNGGNAWHRGMTVDGRGNVFVADPSNNTIRRIAPDGTVTTVAGAPGQYDTGSADGVGELAQFHYPQDVAVDRAGNLYVADTYNCTIRRITPDGVVTTFAGSATSGGTADGVGADARFYGPGGVAVDASGVIYVADTGNNAIRRITASGIVTTLAGTPGEYNRGSDDGTGPAAQFRNPSGIAVDRDGNLIVADTGNSMIRKVTVSGVVTTIAGAPGFLGLGSADGAGADARFYFPSALCVGPDGSIFVADTGNDTIRKITPEGLVSTVGGSARQQGDVDGPGATALFSWPGGITADGAGRLYIMDGNNSVVRKGRPNIPEAPSFILQPANQVAVAGGAARFRVEATGVPGACTYRWQTSPFGNSAWSDVAEGGHFAGTTTAELTVSAVTLAMSGQRFRAVADNGVSPAANSDSATLVVAMPAAYEFSTLGVFNGPDKPGDGLASAAAFNRPNDLAVDGAGNIFVVDTDNNTIRKIAPDGMVTTFAGGYRKPGVQNGVGTSAGFGRGIYSSPGTVLLGNLGPRGMAMAPDGAMYVTDSGNHTIRKITPDGTVTTFAGYARESGVADGIGDFARFNTPVGIAVDAAGYLYVADSENHAIRKVSPDRVVTTIAGRVGEAGTADGTVDAARFNTPTGVAVDAQGDLWISDTGNQTIRHIANGVVTTVAGAAGSAGAADGPAEQARFRNPGGIAVDVDQTLLVADAGNNAIRRVARDGWVATVAGILPQGAPSDYTTQGAVDGINTVAEFNSPTGVAVDGHGNIYVADTNNGTIRRIDSRGSVRTVAGAAVRVNDPTGIAVSPAGDVFVVNGLGGTTPTRVLRLSPDGALSPAIASSTSTHYNDVATARDGSAYLVNSNGPGLQLVLPNGVVHRIPVIRVATAVTVDRDFNAYVVDINSPYIVKVPDLGERAGLGDIVTLAGSPNRGSADGQGEAAGFGLVYGMAADPAGNIFAADTDHHTIRRITPDGNVDTIAGAAGQPGSADGNGGAARFSSPHDVAVDASGYVYVADTGNHTIRRISPAGEVTTIGGLVGVSGVTDGDGNVARFSSPSGVAIDARGNLYVADRGSSRIRKGTPKLVPVTSVLAWSDPSPIDYGTALSGAQLNATANVPGTFTYSPAPGAILSPGAHALQATFTPLEGTGASGATATVTLWVKQTFIAQQPQSQAATGGANVTLACTPASGVDAGAVRWTRNGDAIDGAAGSNLELTNLGPGQTGLYNAVVTKGDVSVISEPAIVGLQTAAKTAGDGVEVGSNIFVASNGNTFDQVLLTGPAASVTADFVQSQITRTSFIDLDDDIVQVEFSGPGTLSVVLDTPTGPAFPANYNQSVSYMKGHAGIVITGATEYSNVSVFSVGRATAVNQDLFKADVAYDGIADIAFIAILSANGKFGGVRTANADYFAAKGMTGLYAPGVTFVGPVYIGNVSAFDAAVPAIVLGSALGDTRITGGDLFQANGAAVQVSGISRLSFTAGTDSHGNVIPAKQNGAVLRQDGRDVTADIVVNPTD
ncbi:MAG TPA: hypothetical protein VHE13_00540 [Opitutus sp.]|nr:hypothetical protein [Opitutus sp.]